MPRPRAYWIRLDQGVHDHPKIIALAESLDVSRVTIVGHLTRLWLWCSVYRPNGRTEGLTDRVLAEAAAWTGDANQFRSCMAAARLLERGRHGEQLRGWTLRNGYQNREAVRKPKRTPSNHARITRDTSTNHAPTDVPIRTVQTEKKEPPYPRRARRACVYEPGFLRAWGTYPHFGQRSRKGKAAGVWKRDNLEPQAEAVVAWIEAGKRTDDWTRDSGRFVPAMEAWLNGRDFTDPPTAPKPTKPDARSAFDETPNRLLTDAEKAERRMREARP